MKLTISKRTALLSAATLMLCALAACGAARAAESTLGSAPVTQGSSLAQGVASSSAEDPAEEANALYLSKEEIAAQASVFLQKGFGYAEAAPEKLLMLGGGEIRGRACEMVTYDTEEPDQETGFGVVLWLDSLTGKVLSARDSGRRSREINDMQWPAFATADPKTLLPAVDRTAPDYEAFAVAMCDAAQRIVQDTGIAGSATVVRCDYAPPDANREAGEGAEPLAVRVTLSDNTAYQFTMNPRTFALWDCETAEPITG